MIIEPSYNPGNLQVQSPSPTTKDNSRVKRIVEIIALAALALSLVAIAFATGFVLSGIVAAVIAATGTAVLITIAAIVYKILQKNSDGNVSAHLWTVKMIKEHIAASTLVLMERIEREEKKLPLSKTQQLKPLPPLCDLNEYTCPVSLDFPFTKWETNEMGELIEDLSLLKIPPHTKDEPTTISIQRYIQSKLLKLVRTESLLFGWAFVAKYIDDNHHQQNSQKYFPIIKNLSLEGRLLIKGFVQRLEWIMEIFKNSKVAFDQKLCLELLATDIPLIDRNDIFLNQCEDIVTEMLKKNPVLWNQWRATQKAGVPWPHDHQILNDLEKQGFVFRPMAVKRDRCKCVVCGIEVSMWRPWSTPSKLHDYSKH